MVLPQLKDGVFRLSDAENRVTKPTRKPAGNINGPRRGWLWELFEEMFEVPYL